MVYAWYMTTRLKRSSCVVGKEIETMTIRDDKPFDDFDEFVKHHQIKDEGMGAAFAAWLSQLGWDGDFEKVEEWVYETEQQLDTYLDN